MSKMSFHIRTLLPIFVIATTYKIASISCFNCFSGAKGNSPSACKKRFNLVHGAWNSLPPEEKKVCMLHTYVGSGSIKLL